MEKERIKQAVRDNYSQVAKTDNKVNEEGRPSSCCGPADTSPGTENKEAFCCSPVHGLPSTSTGKISSCASATPEEISSAIGYTDENIRNVPEGANLGLGCGNPVALAFLKTGETVVDLGSGAGFDCFLAAKEVGETGHVIGVDMTPEMISKARVNAEKSGADNVEFRLGEIEHLPVADSSADLIMSNCVINLSPDKESVYSEAFRILKPGGRIAISDILATTELPDEIKEDLDLVSACVGGAETIAQTAKMLKKVGFNDIRITPKDKSRELLNQWAPGTKAGDYVVSAYIEASKA